MVTVLDAHTRVRDSLFDHYFSAFDAEALIRRHAVPDLRPSPGLVTNFLGVRIDPVFVPSILPAMAGTVEGIPIPANWHADIAEWAAALRAVELARGTFAMIELGCGWGCWINQTAAAARRRGLALDLIGVEGDEGHLAFARQSATTNAIATTELTLHHGIAAADGGVALFPRQDAPGGTWASAPVFGASEEEQGRLLATGHYDALPMIALSAAIGDRRRIDLIHIDIQGGEADLVAACLPILTERVGYLVIGTHSRQIEGRLFNDMLGAGWVLEMDRPAILDLQLPPPFLRVDGLQGWRNPRVTPVEPETPVSLG
ncbi:class I SAM-dependent methyltransferase [Methylobacterium sp. WL69]|uniref:class I SAM-dependent methyltransferase n=1 Tax=Methylobacterium sp. WL69 TaxID=2603893 RepID=UPI0011C9E648|nr:class I SAM-dependent methyltransferase [Methylobacterium sp. WL69]TXM71528.1 class I SAM-dependent methyltransferase [Methylobacterium sp. WL69]